MTRVRRVMGIIDDEGDPDDQDDKSVNGSDGMGGSYHLNILRLLEHVRLAVLRIEESIMVDETSSFHFITKS